MNTTPGEERAELLDELHDMADGDAGCRQEVRISLTPTQRLEVSRIAARLGMKPMVLIGRLLAEEWDRSFGDTHAERLAAIHHEVHAHEVG